MGGFQRACSVDEVPAGTALAVEVGGVDVAVLHCDEEFFAVHDECSHASIPLSEGEVEGCEIECWLHGSRFDARTGKALGLPATEPVPVYPCKVEAGEVLVDVDNPLNKTELES